MKENNENSRTVHISTKYSKIEVQGFDEKAARLGVGRSEVIHGLIEKGSKFEALKDRAIKDIQTEIPLYGLQASDLFDVDELKRKAAFRALDALHIEAGKLRKKSEIMNLLWKRRMEAKNAGVHEGR